MIVHLIAGGDREALYSTEMESWDKENIASFARIVENFGSASDLRFCSVIAGETMFVYVPKSSIHYLEFTQEEYNLMYDPVQTTKKE